MANKKRAATDETAYNADEAAISGNSEAAEEENAAENAVIFENSDTKKADESARTAEKTVIAETEKKVKRIYVYIGPSIKGVITSGSIFAGDKKEILSRIEVSAKAAGAENLMENIGRLIFADVNVASARDKLKAGGNSLSIAYNAVAAGKEGL